MSSTRPRWCFKWIKGCERNPFNWTLITLYSFWFGSVCLYSVLAAEDVFFTSSSSSSSLFDPTKFQGFLLCICRRCVFTTTTRRRVRMILRRMTMMTDDDDDDDNNSRHVFLYPLFGLRGRNYFTAPEVFAQNTRKFASFNFLFFFLLCRWNSTTTHESHERTIRKSRRIQLLCITWWWYTD